MVYARKACCRVCDKPLDLAYRPFCSKACADVDLSRWFKGLYRVEGRDGEAGMGHDPSQKNHDDEL